MSESMDRGVTKAVSTQGVTSGGAPRDNNQGVTHENDLASTDGDGDRSCTSGPHNRPGRGGPRRTTGVRALCEWRYWFDRRRQCVPAGGGTINLTAGCTYSLTAADNPGNGLPAVTSQIGVNGNGATIDAEPKRSVLFEVDGPGGNLTPQQCDRDRWFGRGHRGRHRDPAAR